MKFDEKEFPFTDDQIQDLIYDFMYKSGIDPVKYKIPNFQSFINQYGLDLTVMKKPEIFVYPLGGSSNSVGTGE